MHQHPQAKRSLRAWLKVMGLAWWTLHPAPYTPHHQTLPLTPTLHNRSPSPFTLHHDTLHPSLYNLLPYALHPAPYTLHSAPQYPTPYTLHPTPYTLHPTPSCLVHVLQRATPHTHASTNQEELVRLVEGAEAHGLITWCM